MTLEKTPSTSNSPSTDKDLSSHLAELAITDPQQFSIVLTDMIQMLVRTVLVKELRSFEQRLLLQLGEEELGKSEDGSHDH